MINKTLGKQLIAPAIAMAIFLIITLTYLSPLLKDKVIKQTDNENAIGMAKDAVDYNNTHNDQSLWSNAMFGGMPTYNTALKPSNSNVLSKIRNVLTLNLPNPANIVFLFLIGFYILLSVFGVNQWLRIIGAIAFTFSTYFFIIIGVGHITKALVLALMAPSFAGLYLLFQKKYWLGFITFAFFFSLQVYCNHYQITYYFVLFCLIYGAIELIKIVKEKDFIGLGKISLAIIITSILTIGMNARNILITASHTQYTTRGATEQISTSSNTTSGLDKDYATGWSYGKAESMSLLIPSFKGFSSSLPIGENKAALAAVDQQYKQNIANIPQYWGDQPGTTNTYAGAICIFLFVLGLIIVPGNIKYALLINSVLFLMLAWGKNFMGLTDFMLDYFPGYNKFRAVSTCMVMVQFAIPLLGILALDKLIKEKAFFNSSSTFFGNTIKNEKLFYISFALTEGLSLLFYFIPSLTEFFAAGEYDNIQKQVAESNGAEIARQFLDNIEQARIAIFKSSALRSFGFILTACLAIYAYAKDIIKNQNILFGFLGLLILVDMWPVNKLSLNDKSFVSKASYKRPFEEKPANTFILKDSDPNFRVLNVAVSTFNDASTSYYHKSIGGYNGAKLKRYQELIETRLTDNIQELINTLKNNPTDSGIKNAFASQQILNMLNMKYLIYNNESAPLVNTERYGNAWFVNEVKTVATANEALDAMKSFNAKQTAIIEQKHLADLNGFKPMASNANDVIKLIAYEPNELTYEANASTNLLAVFSEVYYAKGWMAYIDNKPASHTRVNYILRAMQIPAGKHKVMFKFESEPNETGIKIAGVSSVLFIITLVFATYMHFKRAKE